MRIGRADLCNRAIRPTRLLLLSIRPTAPHPNLVRLQALSFSCYDQPPFSPPSRRFVCSVQPLSERASAVVSAAHCGAGLDCSRLCLCHCMRRPLRRATGSPPLGRPTWASCRHSRLLVEAPASHRDLSKRGYAGCCACRLAPCHCQTSSSSISSPSSSRRYSSTSRSRCRPSSSTRTPPCADTTQPSLPRCAPRRRGIAS
mmetsp:Transcript_32940/g.76969  ORF Transcript_32940/g.76969 Transcript_32940/m.76969 type:complete len:201 (-) Transcript_32940:1817-2419(-)